MSRAKKLLLVSVVLAIGIGLAWPFRKQADDVMPTGASPAEPALQFPQQSQSPPLALGQDSGKGVAAQMASTAEPAALIDFDIQNHPALAKTRREAPAATSRPVVESPVTPPLPPSNSGSRPAYATRPTAAPDEAAWPEEMIHEVRNGDTLEKLAERYLGDAGRALELFDLNRERLTNPHLLPIGAELIIPVPAGQEID